MFFAKFKFDKNFLITTLKIALPLMLQQLVVSSVNLIDNLMVGFLGDVALGGVTSVNKIYMVASFATFGMATAGSVFMAQYYGAKNFDRLKHTFRFMILSTLVLNLFFFTVGKIFPTFVLSYFSKDLRVIDSGLSYFSIAVYTFIPLALTISISNAIRAMGDAKVLLYISLVAVVTNTFLNYCLIFGNFNFPALGVRGAAIATLIARIIEVLMGLLVLYFKRYAFNTKLSDLFKVEKVVGKSILIKALPLSLNETLWSGGMATIFKFYSTRGLEVMSGSAIASTIGDIFFILFGGMAMVTTVMVSQRLGADKKEEARQVAYKLLGVSFVLALFFGSGLFLFSFIIPYLYNNVSFEAKRVAINIVRIQSFMFWIYMFTAECYFILRSGGDMKNTLLMDSGFMWLLNIPLVAVFTYFTNVSYLFLYILTQSTDIVKLIFSYHLLKKENWIKNLAI